MRTEAAVALLRRTTLFAALSESTLRALADRAVQRSFPRLTPSGSRPSCWHLPPTPPRMDPVETLTADRARTTHLRVNRRTRGVSAA
jgi:hypothetical protein